MVLLGAGLWGNPGVKVCGMSTLTCWVGVGVGVGGGGCPSFYYTAYLSFFYNLFLLTYWLKGKYPDLDMQHISRTGNKESILHKRVSMWPIRRGGRKLEGSHFQIYSYFDEYKRNDAILFECCFLQQYELSCYVPQHKPIEATLHMVGLAWFIYTALLMYL